MPDLFKSATLTQYSNMRNRFGPKYNTAGELTKPGRTIPFTLDDYRSWLQQMMETPAGIRCAYCDRPLAITAVSPDHVLPVKRGGGLGLDNLATADQDCNRAKGELDGDEFRALLQGLDTFPKAAKNYVLKCMRSAAMGARLRFFPRDKAKGPKKAMADAKAPQGLFEKEF